MTRTVKVEVEDCNFHVRSSFEIPDTGDGSINSFIAHRRMAAQYGEPRECRHHLTSDYHYEFGVRPVGRWTAIEGSRAFPSPQESFAHARKRIAEIGEEMRALREERAVIKEWLRYQASLSRRRKR
ncbi:MAG: hypothetical protein KC777_05530 [Cyanobacteria bacterium HKST-UBA02]|nr:hypothetical protein [Cyanobacteria bacterium HKST-UBA02]